MKPSFIVAPLAALWGSSMAASLSQRASQGVTRTSQDYFAVARDFYDQLTDAIAEDVANLINSGMTIEDIKAARMEDSEYVINDLGGLDTALSDAVGVHLSDVEGVQEVEPVRRSVEAGNPLGKLLMGLGKGGMGGGNSTMKKDDIMKKIISKVKNPKAKEALKKGGRKGSNFFATLFPVSSLVKKLGLGPLAPVTMLVDGLLLALLGLGPIVGKLLLKLGLIGKKKK